MSLCVRYSDSHNAVRRKAKNVYVRCDVSHDGGYAAYSLLWGVTPRTLGSTRRHKKRNLLCPALNVEKSASSENLVHIYQTTLCQISEGLTLECSRSLVFTQHSKWTQDSHISTRHSAGYSPRIQLLNYGILCFIFF
jgi:hypothetical protein